MVRFVTLLPGHGCVVVAPEAMTLSETQQAKLARLSCKATLTKKQEKKLQKLRKLQSKSREVSVEKSQEISVKKSQVISVEKEKLPTHFGAEKKRKVEKMSESPPEKVPKAGTKKDLPLVCCGCGSEFIFSADDQDWFAAHEWYRPKRCVECAAQKKGRRNRQRDGGGPSGPQRSVCAEAPLSPRRAQRSRWGPPRPVR